MIVFSGEMLTFNTFSSSLADDDDFVVHRNNPPMGLSFRTGGCGADAGVLFSLPVVVVIVADPSVPPAECAGTVPHSELGGLDLLEENRLVGLKIASSFSTAGEYVLPVLAGAIVEAPPLSATLGWLPPPIEAIQEVLRTRGGFSAGACLHDVAAGLWEVVRNVF